MRCGRAIKTIVASGSRPAPETPLKQRAVERTGTLVVRAGTGAKSQELSASGGGCGDVLHANQAPAPL